MTDPNHLSRTDRHAKRRNNRIQLIVLIVLAILCAILLFSLLFKKDTQDTNENEQDLATENVEKDKDESKEEEKASSNNDQSEENTNNDDSVKEEEENNGIIKKEDYVKDIIKEEMYTTDENVEEAFVADWPPIGTNQTGAHTVNYENNSEDRKEIKTAISYVTDLEEDEIIEHWVGNGGEQKVIATVSNKDESKRYKVYLQWEIEKGWKPTKVESLKSINTEQ